MFVTAHLLARLLGLIEVSVNDQREQAYYGRPSPCICTIHMADMYVEYHEL